MTLQGGWGVPLSSPWEGPFDATGEFYRANLMSFVLGGACNSRINLNLREDKQHVQYAFYAHASCINSMMLSVYTLLKFLTVRYQ